MIPPLQPDPRWAAIWEAQTRFKIWFEIEAHATDALAELGIVPKESRRDHLGQRQKVPPFDVGRIDEIGARGQARRHRVPHPSRRNHRAGGALSSTRA